MPLHLDGKSKPGPLGIDWKRVAEGQEARIAQLDALLDEAHDTLHKVLGVYISDVDSAHGRVSDLMRRMREARSH